MSAIDRGERIIIQLKNSELYEGNLEYIDEILLDIYEIQFRGKSLKGHLVFYIEEIEMICRFNKNHEDILVNGIIEIDNKIKTIKLPMEEFEYLRKMNENYILITSFEKRYQQAINDLYQCESIGVVSLGHTFDYTRGFSILVICTLEKIYIFDMLCLTELKDLSAIFQSHHITKVVHGGNILNHRLRYKYYVKFNNVFDTQVADSFLLKKNQSIDATRSISECLASHLNFPSSLLATTLEHKTEEEWTERPLNKSDFMLSCNLAIYLLPLREYLRRELLKEFIDETERKYKEN